MKLIPLVLALIFAGTPLSDADYNNLPQMSSDLLGEPKTIGQMRIEDKYWVPAHALSVDMHAKCWLDPNCKLDEKSDHVIQVRRYKKITTTRYGSPKGAIIGYAVNIDKKKLQGWRWKLTTVNKDENIPVRSLTFYND